MMKRFVLVAFAIAIAACGKRSSAPAPRVRTSENHPFYVDMYYACLHGETELSINIENIEPRVQAARTMYCLFGQPHGQQTIAGAMEQVRRRFPPAFIYSQTALAWGVYVHLNVEDHERVLTFKAEELQSLWRDVGIDRVVMRERWQDGPLELVMR